MTDDELAAALRGTTDPLELTRLAAAVCARRLAKEVELGRDSGAVVDLKKSIEEVRRTEKGLIDLGVAKGELIPLNRARALAGAVAARFVAALDRLEAAFPRWLEARLAEPGFTEAETEDRARTVRAWVRGEARTARATATEDLERLLEEVTE